VIDRMRLYLCLHALSHKALRRRDDHVILLSDQKPVRNVFPQRATGGHRDAVERNRPLHGREHCPIFSGWFGANAVAKASSGSQILSAAPALAMSEGTGHTTICNRDQTTGISPSNTPISASAALGVGAERAARLKRRTQLADGCFHQNTDTGHWSRASPPKETVRRSPAAMKEAARETPCR
jgi:hypothetical protein